MNDQPLLTKPQILFFYAAFAVVYISGLFVPLMENDSAQHATMAMRMALENNFAEIFKGDRPYLDKPHLHFWLAAFSMKMLGLNAVAYRIPSLLMLAIAAFSTKKITNLLYEDEQIGHVSALIFLAAQTIVLSAHDVRTDAVLTGFIALSIWQFLKFIKNGNVASAAFAGFSTAMAFSAKGQMAVVIIGFSMFSYLVYSRKWKKFFNIKIIATVLAFALSIIPVVSAYYHQFGSEGVKFILFNQSFNRLNANGFQETSPDYLFFFHTLLWAFLPFSLLFYTGVFTETKFFVKNKFRYIAGKEFLTVGGFWLVILLFSFSKFKLPHYLNGLIPVLSVFTSAFLYSLKENSKTKIVNVLLIIQTIVVFAGTAVLAFLLIYFTGINNVFFYTISVLCFAGLFYLIFRNDSVFRKYLLVSLIFSVAINIFLNTQFYPVLTRYQGGMKLAEFVNESHMPKDKILMPEDYETWSFDFYTKRNTPRVSLEKIKSGNILLVKEHDLPKIFHKYQILKTETHYRITRLSLKFLNPKTRASQLEKYCLIKITD